MARLNTQLHAKGAEFLVLGQLLIRGIESYQCHSNQQGYDVIATNGQNVCRIQVKSRFHTGSDSFPISNFDCDVVVFVALNRGYSTPKMNGDTGISEPLFYVLPIDVLQHAQDGHQKWNKVQLRRIDNLSQYKEAWHLIAQFLEHSQKLQLIEI
jgi:hypothetical protein